MDIYSQAVIFKAKIQNIGRVHH